MKKAIVTGSNGFIGSNVCKRLCADGIKVFAIVKDENENIDNIKNLSNIEIVYCELDEIETLADIISDRDIDVFYHFAWVGSAGSLRCDENEAHELHPCEKPCRKPRQDCVQGR